MMFKYACRDLGGDCDFETTGATVEEVTQKVFTHVQIAHKDMLSKMSPVELAEMNKRVLCAIHQV
jgi:predicted small metal-binding protein